MSKNKKHRIVKGTLTLAVASVMVIQGTQLKISAASRADTYYSKESVHSGVSLANMNQNVGNTVSAETKAALKILAVLDNNIFTDQNHTALRKGPLLQQIIYTARQSLSELSDTADRDYLNMELDKAQSMIDGTYVTPKPKDQNDESIDSTDTKEALRILAILNKNIFTDEKHTSLKNNGSVKQVIAIERAEVAKLAESTNKIYLNLELDKAQRLLDNAVEMSKPVAQSAKKVSAEEAQELLKVLGILDNFIFTNKDHKALKKGPMIQQIINVARETLSELSDTADRDYLNMELDKGQSMLDGTYVAPEPTNQNEGNVVSADTKEALRILAILNKNIFTDEKHTSLKNNGSVKQVIAIERAEVAKLAESTNKIYLNLELDKAQRLLDNAVEMSKPVAQSAKKVSAEEAQELLKVLGILDNFIFTNKDHKELKKGPMIQQIINVARETLSELSDTADRDYLNMELDKAQCMLEATYATPKPVPTNRGNVSSDEAKALVYVLSILDSKIFADKNHTVLRHNGLERQIIAIAKAELSKLPESGDKDYLNIQLDKATSMLELS